MNIDTLAGEGTRTKGDFKRGLGDVTGDTRLQQDGAADQLSGGLRKGVGQVRDFVRKNPAASYTAAGIFGLAILNSLRGKSTRRATR
ncbi:CsbD family protein [Sphingomonas sp. LHG3406-1]|uniref:CsbD family protein n=1 Tax=Sphingomonas sp. LHG3406-1 TaxID=2804617 RepID=UPI002639861D|nr:CsbD family protein [Sphingomonas sp. LHG3406-1]